MLIALGISDDKTSLMELFIEISMSTLLCINHDASFSKMDSFSFFQEDKKDHIENKLCSSFSKCHRLNQFAK